MSVSEARRFEDLCTLTQVTGRLMISDDSGVVLASPKENPQVGFLSVYLLARRSACLCVPRLHAGAPFPIV